MSSTARNVGIVLLLALAVYALPGGGTGADIIQALIGIAFAVGIWFFLMRMYRERRTTIYGLGDSYRLVFYASLAGILFLGAAANRWFDDPALTIAWMVLLGSCIYGLVATFRHYRAYD